MPRDEIALRAMPRLAPWAPGLIGFALSGFFDGVLFHQILQWHHLLSLVEGAGGLAAQVLWDGAFHALMYVLAAVGLWLLWKGRRGLDAPGAGRRVAGWGMVGFGLWHVVDAVISHWALRIHRIRVDAESPLLWDVGVFALLGLGPLIAGLWLLRRKGGGGGGRQAVALGLAALVAGPIAATPGPQEPLALVVFLSAQGLPEVAAAAAAAGGRPVWSDAGGRVWAVELGPQAVPSRLYRHGAVMVSQGPLALGCLSRSRV